MVDAGVVYFLFHLGRAALDADILSVNGIVFTVLALSPFFFYFLGLGIFTRSYFRFVEEKRKNELRPILMASIIGVFAFVYPFAIGLSDPFVIFLNPVRLLPGLLIVGVPFAFGYSIFRHRLMGIDLIVKRSLIYGLVTALIAAIYLGLVFGVGSLLGNIIGHSENELANVVAFITIALLFDPIKRRTQNWIDRFFYQERYNVTPQPIAGRHDKTS